LAHIRLHYLHPTYFHPLASPPIIVLTPCPTIENPVSVLDFAVFFIYSGQKWEKVGEVFRATSSCK
jgi:hypothetical protein